MAKDAMKFSGFDFMFDPTLDPQEGDYDAGEDSPGPFLPNVEGRTEFLPPDAERIPKIENAVDRDSAEYAARPAEDRTRELFSQMHAQRSILAGIVEAAHEPITIDDAEQATATLRAQRFSLYSTANLCAMLEKAGALSRVDEQGGPFEAKAAEPDIVTIDGEDYYAPAPPAKIHWLATEAGLAVAAEDEPDERIRRLFGRETEFLSIHKRVLSMAAREGGTTMPDLSAAVDGNPLIADPRRFFVQHFVEGLERSNALAWTGSSWEATEAGKAALGLLADVNDDWEPEGEGDGFTVATETDGVRW